jgi:hypothetical protein
MGGRRQMETAAAKAKGLNGGDRNNGRDRNNGKDRNNGGDRNKGKDHNSGGDRKNGKDRNAKPVTVNRTKGTPTMPALASQDVAADDCHIFAGVQIPKWDPVFKTASLRKAKAEMPKTYLELVLLKEVLDSVNEHMSAGRNSKGTVEIMTAALHAQFNRRRYADDPPPFRRLATELLLQLLLLCGTTTYS